MRESIGTISLLNFIFVYIFILFAIIAGTMSYYRTYRVNNAIVRAIEKYEGYNDLSRLDIVQRLDTLAYERLGDTECDPNKRQYYSRTNAIVGNLVNNTTYVNDGYCVYRYENDTNVKNKNRNGNATTDPYDTYEVVTYMRFSFPIIDSTMKIKTSAKTIRMYHFKES